MADVLDQAQVTEQILQQAALAKREPEFKPKGSCYWCEAPITAGAFCDADCRDDFVQHRCRTNGGF